MARDFTPDDDFYARLAEDCGCDLPELAQQAIAKFNAGEYYEQHDLLEALWMRTESPVRQLYQGILQIGVGYYQIRQGNWRGAVKMLNRGLRWLNYLPTACQGVDVAQLRADAEAMRAELLRLRDGDLADVDPALFKPVKLLPREA